MFLDHLKLISSVNNCDRTKKIKRTISVHKLFDTGYFFEIFVDLLFYLGLLNSSHYTHFLLAQHRFNGTYNETNNCLSVKTHATFIPFNLVLITYYFVATLMAI